MPVFKLKPPPFAMPHVPSRDHPRVPMDAPLGFPQDEGAHPSAKTEWWYVSGHLFAQDGERFDFYTALSFMPDVGAVKFNYDHWHPRPPVPSIMGMYIWDSAITVTAPGQDPFHLPVRHFRPAPPRWEAQPVKEGGLDVNFKPVLGAPARIFRTTDTSISLHAPFKEHMAVELTLDHAAFPNPLLLGGDGTIPMGPQGLSRYYSFPLLEARGSVVRDGVVKQVTGTAWMDHQWGDMSFFDGWDRWKWFGIQLDGGPQVVTFEFLDQAGQVQTHASMQHPDGNRHLASLRADGQAPVMSVVETGPGWRSHQTGVTYPLLCRVTVPDWNLDLEVTPVAEDQEVEGKGPAGVVTPGPFFPNYWEGGATVRGTWEGRPVTGQAYEELVGWFAPHWVIRPWSSKLLVETAAELTNWLHDNAHTDPDGQPIL